MSEIITVRDGDIIAAEINTIKEDTRRVMIANAIRIGGKLMEAKSMVDHGQWGKWLEEKVDYSQSTANNLMKLYQEYGTRQESLFDNWTNSETFAKLNYTQHMALLALPFADRAEFAERHNVEEMSTRELEKTVREEIDRLKAELQDKNAELEAAGSDRNQLEEKLAQALGRAKEAESEITNHAKAADKALKDRERAEKSEKNALNLMEKLKKDLSAAEAAKAEAEKKLAEAKERPEIPESAMEELRRQVEKEAAEKAAAEVKKKLEDAQKVAQEAKVARAEAEEKLSALQKQVKISDPDIIAFQTLAQSMQQSYTDLNKCRLKVAERDPDAAGRLAAFQRALLTQWIDIIEGV